MNSLSTARDISAAIIRLRKPGVDVGSDLADDHSSCNIVHYSTTCGVLDVDDREYRAALSGKMPFLPRISIQFALLLWMVLHMRGLHSKHSSDRGFSDLGQVGQILKSTKTVPLKAGSKQMPLLVTTKLKSVNLGTLDYKPRSLRGQPIADSYDKGANSTNQVIFLRAAAAVPGAPTGVYGVQSPSEKGVVWVTWTPPTDHNSTIRTFEVTIQHARMDTARPVGAVNTTGIPAPNSVNITNLTTGAGYTFKVRAINSAGSGVYSEESEVVVLVPGRITNAVVSLSTNKAGESGTMLLTFTCQHDFSRRGYILFELPDSTFTIKPNAAAVVVKSVPSGSSNSSSFSPIINGSSLVMSYEGSSADILAGELIGLTISSVTNPAFEGTTGPFTIKTLESDKSTPIDETSAEYNSVNRPPGVVITPGRFRDPPTLMLSTYLAGGVGAASISFIPSNPLPADGHIFVEFPRNFSSVNCTAAVASGVDGGLLVSMADDGYTVDILRDGTGTAVESGVNISVKLVGVIANQHFEGMSDVFPLVKTTMADSNVSIDEASMNYNSADRSAAVRFTPGAFMSPAVVSLASYVAGTEGGADITFSVSNPIPSDGHVVVEFTRSFGRVSSSSNVTASGIDGGFSISVDTNCFRVDIKRDGTGTETPTGSSIRLTFRDGIVNQMFEGLSGVFPLLKTTLRDVNVSIDETSSDHNSDDRPSGVLFTPGSFAEQPTVRLQSYEAGIVGGFIVNFTLSNPLPVDGHVIIEFPTNFTSINCTTATAFGVDGGFEVSVGSDGYTVGIHRDGTGSEAQRLSPISVHLDGITNQYFEGPSGVFPMVKTTLSDATISIDEASANINSADRPSGVLFTPGAFPSRPKVIVHSYEAGAQGSVNISFTNSNWWPSDGHIVVRFPSNFPKVFPNTTVFAYYGVDGGFTPVAVAEDEGIVFIRRDGNGTDVAPGTEITIKLVNGVTNQNFEGSSDIFPMFKTTLCDTNISIDEASLEFDSVNRPLGVLFTPAAFSRSPTVALRSYAAGAAGGATISFTTSNPLPVDGRVIVTFPSNFTSVNCSKALASGLDGGLVVHVAADGYRVDIQRDGTGSVVEAGTDVTLMLLDGIVNTRFEGLSDPFPVVKTTLKHANVSIDEASSDFNAKDRPSGVSFIPGAFAEAPSVSLDSYIAGAKGGANVIFSVTNPVPLDGRVIIEFPGKFSSISCTRATADGIDGGFKVTVEPDGYTVHVQRDGTGSDLPGGAKVSIYLEDGIMNERFEGMSGVFPVIKTTLADSSVSIDEASGDYNSADRASSVHFTPGAFLSERPRVSLTSYVAGAESDATVSFVTANPLPIDGHIILQFPSNFSAINCTTAIADGIDGGFIVSVALDGYTLDVHRDGTGTQVPSGANLTVRLVDAVINQKFSGMSTTFPVLKTTLDDAAISIDEASVDFNSHDRPAGVLFTPGSFVDLPSVVLSTYEAGAESAASISFTTSNPVPLDGHVVIAFPSQFTSIETTSAEILVVGLDVRFHLRVSKISQYIIDVQLDGTGTNVVLIEGGISVVLMLAGGIKNQVFEGLSDKFGLKTTLADISVAIDEASLDHNTANRAEAIYFTPGAFAEQATITLLSYEAGSMGGATLIFTAANPIPSDGHVVVEFPQNFTSISTNTIVSSGMDGGFSVDTSNDASTHTHTMDIQRDGTGTDVAGGRKVSLRMLDGITNQLFEGSTGVFPLVKTTLRNVNVSIDEASSEYNSRDRPAGVTFIPGRFTVAPVVQLGSHDAGFEGAANVTFTVANPIPPDGHVIIQFPSNFTSINCTDGVTAIGMGGGLLVSNRLGTHTVDIERDGTGEVVQSGVVVSVKFLSGIRNQGHEGVSHVFPLVKTTLDDVHVSIDETSSVFHSFDRPAGAWFMPAAFVTTPVVELSTNVAGEEGNVNVTFTTANPVPPDGHVIIEFPKNFTKISCTKVVASGMDGGLDVAVVEKGFTVDVRRDGSGVGVEAGARISVVLLNGITNQQFEGTSGFFPVVKTTLTNSQLSIDEASADFNSDDRPAGVRFTPGKFDIAPVVDLASYDAGAETSVNLSFTVSNPLPVDGHVIIEFPSAFTSVLPSALLSSGVDGGFFISLGGNGRTVDLQRDGTGTEVDPGKQLSFQLVGGIVNQRFEGQSDVFPVVKTTLQDTSISIDEVSSVYNSARRPVGVIFTPGRFGSPPVIRLQSDIAGVEGAGNISFTPANPLPSDGHVIIEFPPNFKTINCTAVSPVGIDGGLLVSVSEDSNGYTVDIERDGTGNAVDAGTNISIILGDGIRNQPFEGASDLFPSMTTTLTDTAISIDEASSAYHSADQPAVFFKPGAFTEPPTILLENYAAGAEGAANISFTTSNPLPPDAHVIVMFPRNFLISHARAQVTGEGIDGGLLRPVVGDDNLTVDIQRDGTGSVVEAGASISVRLLDGVKNQKFEGMSATFPLVKTTLGDIDVSIDEASSEYNSGDLPMAIRFIPGAFAARPIFRLESYTAGVKGAAEITLIISNPLPSDGHVVVEFPKNFMPVETGSVMASGIDGGFHVWVAADGYTVHVKRDGTGTDVNAREMVTVTFLDGIENQGFEGVSASFPGVKTTLADVDVSIDEASLDHHGSDRPEPVWFTPGMFFEPPMVTLESYTAGYSGGANISFRTSNPIPSDGHVIVQFPNNFTSVNCTAVTTLGMDGGFSNSVYSGLDGYTVDVERDGTGTEVPSGTIVTVTIVDGVKNQQFEGESGVFPAVKTTLSDTGLSIDEASAVYHDGDRPPAIWFTPAAFVEPPTVSLHSYIAGVESAANVSFTTTNPIPVDGQIIMEFPSDFVSVSCTAATISGIDGGFSVTTAVGSYTVVIQRDGKGTEVEAGQTVTVVLENGIINQQFEGLGKPFPSVKTTLSDSGVAIDDSRQGPNMSAIFFTAARFPVAKASLQYDVAGMGSSIDFSFTIANPMPPEGVLRVEFPDDFASASPILAESQELGALHVIGSYNLTIRRSGSGCWMESGTPINLRLSQITNKVVAGTTGNFAVSTFLDHTMKNRIDRGFLPGVVIGKQILSASADFGSSSVAVASQQKRWAFSGHGVALGDQVKWVNSSAVSDDHCDWRTETTAIAMDSYSNNTTVASVTFEASSEHTGPLQLCYRFSLGDHPFKLYSTITLSVYELYGVSAAAEGSKRVSVVGYPKVLMLSGFGITELDKTKWLLQGRTSCTSSEDVAALAGGGEKGENVAFVSSSREASFEFSDDVFNLKHFSGNASAIVTLCYKFGAEEYQWYPAISLAIHHVTGWTSSVGGASLAVVDVPEHLTFTGYGLSEDPLGSVDRAHWTLSRTSCGENFAEVSEAQHDRVLVSGGQATFTFKASASGETPRLCYWFQDEPVMIYPPLVMKVAQLSMLWAPLFGDNDVAVVGYPKTWGFRGGNIVDGDYVRWIYNESTDCLDTSSEANMSEDGEILSGETICTFAPELSGRWITPCFRHSNEPWHRYDMPVYVKMVHTMTAAWGNSSACVADQPKQWVFHGDGLAPIADTDLVKFIVDATDCTSGSDVTLTGADENGVAMYTTADRKAAFNIQPAAAGKSVYLCYKFGNEEYMWYDIRAYVHHLQSVESRVGGEDIAVVDVEEVLVIHANGASSKDRIRWVVRDDTTLDEDCNESIRVWDSAAAVPEGMMEVPVLFNGGEFTTNFTFDSTSAGLSPALCYKFGEEKWKVYADVTLNVAMLQAVSVNEGSDTVAVVHYAKMWRFMGQFLVAGDQMFWTSMSCDTIAAANIVGDSDGILTLDGTLASWFEFDTPVSGVTLKICYKFNDEPFKEYRNFEIDVRMIRAVAVDIGSARKVIPETAKTFSFVGDGTAVEGGIDSVKWVEGGDCSTHGIVGDVGDLVKRTEFDLVYYDSTSLTAQTIVFPETEIGGPYTLCYAFDEEPYQIYPDLVMTVLGISDVSAEEGSDDIIVIGAPKRLTFTGGGAIEAGDEAVWISGGKTDSDCLNDVFLTGLQSVVDSLFGADFFIPDGHSEAMAGHTWTLCYRFGTESLKIYPSFSLTAVTLDAFPAQVGSDDDSVVGYPKTFLPSGAGVSEGDQAKWVSTSVTTDEGCASEDIAGASPVRWTRFISTNEAPVSTVESATMISTAREEVAVLASSFTFTSATVGWARMQLCYKHQSEPYHLYADITLRTSQLLAASVRALGSQQALTSITDSPQTVAFVAYGGMEGDRYKWVHTTGDFASVMPSTSRNSMSETFFQACAEWVEPAAGSSVGISRGFYQEATFTFSEPTSDLIVCYGPGSEPFMPYPAITMEVISPTVSTARPNHVLVGRYMTVRLIGTFGLTSGDAMKLAQNADGDCSGDPAGGDESIFYPDSTSRGLRLASLGTSVITLYVSQRTEENRPYKLCYRFGSAGVWKMFDHVSWEAYEVTGVSLNIGDDYPAAGQLLDFTFSGTGVMDGDQAKWVNATVSSDDACRDAASVVGSSAAEVLDGIAQFRFNGNVDDWVLCYKHESDDWRLYPGIVPTLKLTATTPSEIALSDTQRTKAEVSMTLEGSIASYPEGSTARANFLDSFLSDLSKALRVPSSRFTVTSMRAGSVVVDFSITSTGSLADASVTELLLDLVQQISDASSALRNGNVTSGAKGVVHTTSLEAELTSSDSPTENVGISLSEFQEKGLFGFTETTWFTTEASGGITLGIHRLHGTKGFVDIGYSTSDKTATGDSDYEITEGVVRFHDGDASKTIEIPIIDDVETEAHFEVFTVSLSLEGPISEGAALVATRADATVYLYDYGDGSNLAGITFDATSTSHNAGSESNSRRWEIIDNGGVGGWVDSNGFAAKDAVIGSDEYDDRCDYAATAPCDHDCRFGGGLAELFPTRGEKSPSVLQLNGTGYVTTVEPITDFPSSSLSITFWTRAISPTGGRGGGTVLSYVAPDASPGETELLLHNLNSLSLLVHGNFVPASKRYDGSTGGDLGGIRTGINLARDGEWHHVGVAWRSSDGRVEAYLDGARVFDGGPYKTLAELPEGGRFVLGQSQSGKCAEDDGDIIWNSSTSTLRACEVFSGDHGPGGLEAQVQRLRLWSKFITANEVAQQMQDPFEGNTIGQVLYWDFNSMLEGNMVEDQSGTGVSISGVPNHGLVSEHGRSFLNTFPTLNPGYPCGAVHSGIWRFAASDDFIAAIRGSKSYGGRLQFRLGYTSANGDIRSERGAVTIRTDGGEEISWTSIFAVAEALPGRWTYVSVVLREDHGWRSEPLGGGVNATKMQRILKNASEILIRGDIRVYGQAGGGQEVVYLQDVTLMAKN